MIRLSRLGVLHPATIVAIGVAVTLGLGAGLTRLQVRTDGLALLPPSAPEVVLDREIRSAFDLEHPLVVFLRAPEPGGAFTLPLLAALREMTEALQRLPGLDSSEVVSLLTEPGLRTRPGTLRAMSLLEPFPRSEADLARLREEVETIGLYTGTLIARDGSAAAIQVGLPDGVERGPLIAEIRRLARRHVAPGVMIDVLGAAAAESLLGQHILEDLRVLVPLALAVMGALFFVAFRRGRAVVQPFLQVGASLVAVFGLMGWVGSPIYLTTAMLPVILIAVGVADVIHILARNERVRAEYPELDPRESVARTMDELWRPILNTALTTAAGFVSFGLSPIPPVRSFGLFTSFGILYCLAWTLLVVPALLVLGRGALTESRPAPLRWLAAPFVRLGMLAYRRPVAAVAALLVVVALLPSGLSRLYVQDSWIGGFARTSTFRRATDAFNRTFLGGHVLALAVDGRPFRVEGDVLAEELENHAFPLTAGERVDPEKLPGSFVELTRPPQGGMPEAVWNSQVATVERRGDRLWVTTPRNHGSARFFWRPDPAERIRYRIVYRPFTQPTVLASVHELGEFLRSETALAVGGVLTPWDYVATTNLIVMRGGEAARRVPDDSGRVYWLWEQYGRTRGAERLRETVDGDYGRVIVPVFMTDANFRDTATLMTRIRDYEKEHLLPQGLSIEMAGDVAVSQGLIQAIVTTQVRSLVFSLVGILVTVAVLLRSVRWGLLATVPTTLAVGADLALMGALDIPLGVATSMFAAITLGIGVDFAIHVIESRRLMRARGHSGEAALRNALERSGPSILLNAASVTLGMLVLVFSRVPANAGLGLLTAVGVTASFLAGIILLPPCFRLADRGAVVAPPPVE